jgi:hypothetical protein
METKQEHNGMQVGDLITTYHKGFWELETIEVRRITQRDIDYYSSYANKILGDEYSPLFHYKKIFDEKGNLAKTKIVNRCDASFCNHAKQHVDKLLTEVNKLQETFNKYELQKKNSL